MQKRNILASILFVLISYMSIAQGGGPCNSPNPPPCCSNTPPCGPPPPPPGLPIDDAIPYALLAAVFIGIRKSLQLDKKSTV